MRCDPSELGRWPSSIAISGIWRIFRVANASKECLCLRRIGDQLILVVNSGTAHVCPSAHRCIRNDVQEHVGANLRVWAIDFAGPGFSHHGNIRIRRHSGGVHHIIMHMGGPQPVVPTSHRERIAANGGVDIQGDARASSVAPADQWPDACAWPLTPRSACRDECRRHSDVRSWSGHPAFGTHLLALKVDDRCETALSFLL
jgi:hypothetical protein